VEHSVCGLTQKEKQLFDVILKEVRKIYNASGYGHIEIDIKKNISFNVVGSTKHSIDLKNG